MIHSTGKTDAAENEHSQKRTDSAAHEIEERTAVEDHDVFIAADSPSRLKIERSDRLAKSETERAASAAAEKAQEEEAWKRKQAETEAAFLKADQLQRENAARECATSLTIAEDELAGLIAAKKQAATEERYLDANSLQEKASALETKIDALMQSQFEILKMRKLSQEDFTASLWETSMANTLRRALKGSAHDQAIVGYTLGRGEGRNADWDEAFKWYQLAASKKHSNAMYVIGLCYAKGRGAMQDWEKAFEYFKNAADHGDVNGMFQAAWCFYHGKGTEKQIDAASWWSKKAAKAGHTNAVKLRDIIVTEIRPTAKAEATLVKHKLHNDQWELASASKLFEDSVLKANPNLRQTIVDAENGDLSAILTIASHCAKGRFVKERSWPVAVKWYRKAAEHGDPQALFFIGAAYSRGLGVAQDWEIAVKHFRKAAYMGCGSAMCNLAYCYANGCGIQQDDQESADLYRQAAMLGDKNAIKYLDSRGLTASLTNMFDAAGADDAVTVRRYVSIRKVQAIQRGRFARRFVVPARARLRATIKIQAAWRGCVVRACLQKKQRTTVPVMTASAPALRMSAKHPAAPPPLTELMAKSQEISQTVAMTSNVWHQAQQQDIGTAVWTDHHSMSSEDDAGALGIAAGIVKRVVSSHYHESDNDDAQTDYSSFSEAEDDESIVYETRRTPFEMSANDVGDDDLSESDPEAFSDFQDDNDTIYSSIISDDSQSYIDRENDINELDYSGEQFQKFDTFEETDATGSSLINRPKPS
eukprot:SAG31_NODE_4392_length_3276_cov_1.588291_1_plen_760_part_10